MNQQARQAESIEDVKARLNDVEDVISVLGDNRESWAKSQLNAGLHEGDQNSNIEMEGAHLGQASGRIDPVPVAQADGSAHLHTAAVGAGRTNGKVPAVQAPERNAELASTDAATTLEFLTLGKDRRRGVEFDAGSSDSEGELAHHDEQGFAGISGPTTISGRPHSLRKRHLEVGSIEQSYDGKSRILKHLRRGLPPRVVSRIESLLQSHPDELPPANLLASLYQACHGWSQGCHAVASSDQEDRRCSQRDWCMAALLCPLPYIRERGGSVRGYRFARYGHPDDHGYEGFRAIDPAWLALFYVICSIAIHQMSEEEGAFCGVGVEQERMRLASELLHAAMDSFSLAEYLVKPSVYCCQTIAILCVAGHNICGSDLLTSLLAIGIKSAQTLGLHALGDRTLSGGLRSAARPSPPTCRHSVRRRRLMQTPR